MGFTSIMVITVIIAIRALIAIFVTNKAIHVVGSPGNESAGDNQNAFNDEPKDDHALLVEWKDCDQLFNLYCM